MLHVSVLRSECYGNLNNRDSIDLASIDHINQFCTNVIIYCQTYFSDYLINHLNYVTLIFNFPSQYNSYQIHQYSSTTWLKVAPYTSGKIWSARLIFFFFGSVFEYIHCNKYQNFNKFQPTDSELYIHYPHSSFSLCGFYHRDAWNLHTNIIWSKRSTDFKELSPCSVRYHLKEPYFNYPLDRFDCNTFIVVIRPWLYFSSLCRRQWKLLYIGLV
jgi:hypothetical protein